MVIQTLRKGGDLQKQFFRPFGPQFGLKIMLRERWGLSPSFGSATDYGH